VLDEWLETQVTPRLSGNCAFAQFTDDAVMVFDNIADAQRALAVLGKRLAVLGLTLHPDKSRLVDLRPGRVEGARHRNTGGTAFDFDFLGLTHVRGAGPGKADHGSADYGQRRFARESPR
jgi:RNA-directed DNA polymerase